MGRKRTPKPKKRKKVTVKLLERMHTGKVTQPYRIMEELIERHHSHLNGARVAICWRFGWNADADGHQKMGQCKKGSDVDRALKPFDFVILLNHELWNQSSFTEEMMRAVIDHELCHAQVSIDADGEPRTDEEGRVCYRIRKHDIEEFQDVVARHGLYKNALVKFAERARDAEDRPLLGDKPKPPKKELLKDPNGRVKTAT